MADKSQLPLDHTVNLLRAAGEHTRLRLLALLSHGDLTVTDLIDILGQSQPRVSRHLKLLSEAGLLERYQEGAWAFFRAVSDGQNARFVKSLLDHMNADDVQLQRDLERLHAVRSKRAAAASQYFSSNASSWDEIRTLHVDESKVEAAMLKLIGSAPFQAMLDLGTGTGRLLELFQDNYTKGVGVDGSREMLSIARSNLEDLSKVQVRQGNLLNLPAYENAFDLVTFHQVLHYLDDPKAAIAEAVKTLAPGGRLMIVDFAPHGLDFLRDKHAHIRLGFASDQISKWLSDCGLEVREVQKLEPKGKLSEKEESLIVTLWLAQDTRTQIA
ncbi:MAG: ArsR/SmtB family transcription factor [Nitratireductor sp.]